MTFLGPDKDNISELIIPKKIFVNLLSILAGNTHYSVRNYYWRGTEQLHVELFVIIIQNKYAFSVLDTASSYIAKHWYLKHWKLSSILSVLIEPENDHYKKLFRGKE